MKLQKRMGHRFLVIWLGRLAHGVKEYQTIEKLKLDQAIISNCVEFHVPLLN